MNVRVTSFLIPNVDGTDVDNVIFFEMLLISARNESFPFLTLHTENVRVEKNGM